MLDSADRRREQQVHEYPFRSCRCTPGKTIKHCAFFGTSVSLYNCYEEVVCFRLRPPGGKQMDKKIAALLGAAAALTTMSGAQSAVAAPAQNTPPTSYRDLLEPVPDALNALKIDDARTAAGKTQGGEQVAQYYHHHHHHHHHHHRYYHHHHHHHHRYYHHHHHHHHGGFGVYIR